MKPKRKPALARTTCSVYRRLRRDAVIKKGDRAMYADKTINCKDIPAHELGMSVAASGYFAVVRKKTPNDKLCHEAGRKDVK